MLILGQHSIQILQEKSVGLITRIFLSLPYVVVVFRPIYILSFVLLKRSTIEATSRAIQIFVDVSFEKKHFHVEEISRLQKKSIGLFFITAGLVLPFAWLVEIAMVSRPEISFFAEDLLLPLPVRMQFWLFILLWSVFFAFSSVLSQQVLAILMLYASVLETSMKCVNTEIQECAERVVNNRSWFELDKQILNWKCVTTQARTLCGEINQSFNLILFGFYGLDFAVLLGFGANIIMGQPINQMWAYNGTSAVIFCSYMTIFLRPLISMHEQVGVEVVDDCVSFKERNAS
jgi:hypothetical protein